MSDEKSKQTRNGRPRYLLHSITTLILLGIGIAIVWLAKNLLGIEGDAIYVVLLIIPMLAFLALQGKLGKISILGASAEFISNIADKIKDNVAEIGEYEENRSSYLGKLRQVLQKDGKNFVLVYADVDGLRELTRTRYNKERKNANKDPQTKRRSDKDIQQEIIQDLKFALTDAFYDKVIEKMKQVTFKEKPKQDTFSLEEPDMIMIIRSMLLTDARDIAENGLKLFKKSDKDYNATIVLLSPHSIDEPDPKKIDPRELDKITSKFLTRKKDERKGKVYVYP